MLDSSAVIIAERKKQPITDFIEAILAAHGPVDVSLSPVTVAELVHGIYRARTLDAAQRRREYIEELVNLVPVHPANQLAPLADGCAVRVAGAVICRQQPAAAKGFVFLSLEETCFGPRGRP